MTKKIILLGLICLALISRNRAQTVTIVDKSDLNPISNINITNQDKNRSAVTSIQGKADLSVFNINDTLTFSHISYQPYITNLK